MEKLMDVYNAIQNPINENEILKKVIEAFSNTEKEIKDNDDEEKKNKRFYTNFQTIDSPKEKLNKGRYVELKNLLYIALFGVWKENIINMTPEKYVEIYGNEGNFSDNDFQELRKNLKSIEIPENANDIIDMMKGNKKYSFIKEDLGIFGNGWVYLSSSRLAEKTSSSQIKHRLYVNISDVGKDRFLFEAIEKFLDKEINFNMKFVEGDSRDDTIVFYLSDDELLEGINILRETKKKTEEFFKEITYFNIKEEFYNPPILSGKIDGWIGYGSEPKETGKLSFNTKRAGIVRNAICKCTKDYFMQNKNNKIDIDGKSTKVSDYLIIKVFNKYMEKINETLKNRKDTANNIKNHEIQKQILMHIRDGVEETLNGRKIDEDIVVFNFSDNSKIAYTQQDIEHIIFENAIEIANVDDRLLKSIREEIKEHCKENGIDENKFCFDIERVKDMQEYDKLSTDIKAQDDRKDIVIEEKLEQQETSNITKEDNKKNGKTDEQKEIEEILKKVLNLTPENRKTAFNVLEALEMAQKEKGENR